MGDDADAACGAGVGCGAEEAEGGGGEAVPSPSFSMIEPNSPMVNPFGERKSVEALVDKRPKCITGVAVILIPPNETGMN